MEFETPPVLAATESPRNKEAFLRNHGDHDFFQKGAFFWCFHARLNLGYMFGIKDFGLCCVSTIYRSISFNHSPIAFKIATSLNNCFHFFWPILAYFFTKLDFPKKWPGICITIRGPGRVFGRYNLTKFCLSHPVLLPNSIPSISPFVMEVPAHKGAA